jgi:predicted RNA-binding Zn-ribbon protein involved in translation (DUF1610 family)
MRVLPPAKWEEPVVSKLGMPENAFRCTNCGNETTPRKPIADPTGSRRTLQMFDCLNCGKTSVKVIDAPPESPSGLNGPAKPSSSDS